MCFVKCLTVTFSVGSATKLIILFPTTRYGFNNSVSLNAFASRGGSRRATGRGQGGEPPHGKLNAKTGPPLVDILIFSILWIVDFCVFRGVIVFLASIDIHDNQRFTIISLPFPRILASGPPTVTSGTLQLSFAPPLAQTSIYATGDWAIAHAKTYENNFIHHDFAQFGKQHTRYQAILPSIILSQGCCEIYFISLTVVNP